MSSKPTVLTPPQEQCLKVIWGLAERGVDPVTNTELAKSLGLGNSTVSDMVRRLVDAGLLSHQPYGAIALTGKGSQDALRMVRRHRILETGLVEIFGYSWDEVHDEADALEHAVSDKLIDRMEGQLGHPTHDPHGDPIPSADGEITRAGGQPLDALKDGARVRVARVSDRKPELLRYLTANGVGIGTTLVLRDSSPMASDVTCVVSGTTRSVTMSRAHAHLVTVVAVEAQHDGDGVRPASAGARTAMPA
ncbi:DtxR family transcriptional regulator, Mn-dependent transcriptional regulator [Propionibacterium cyclohexanicum]|uniref:Manganese transport regulator n=1 Tax=Propionibacterium cyclohexanicum TaxID=64702 RepID=A0A1H9TIJ8_9ACTN|nr:metal-dependent transcriptional regulator [Propionibacterium cyclohexanicum]SER96679.1 DtxR family transcriptional regulator, Mn-dependent transcriptional regulator [Propionibacterium cyclohexanicum]